MARRRSNAKFSKRFGAKFMGITLALFVVIDLVLLGGYDQIKKATSEMRHAHLSMPEPEVFLGSESYDYRISKQMLAEQEAETELQTERELFEALQTPEPENLIERLR